MDYVESVTDLIGNTPLVRLTTSVGATPDAVDGPLVLAKVDPP